MEQLILFFNLIITDLKSCIIAIVSQKEKDPSQGVGVVQEPQGQAKLYLNKIVLNIASQNKLGLSEVTKVLERQTQE